MSTKSYKAKTPIKHDGEDVEIGSTIELDDKHAKPLLQVGAIEEVEEAASTDTNRIASIIEVIGQLDKDNKDHWTKSGAPDLKAINALLKADEPVTGKERDAAWAEMSKETD